MGRSCRVRSHQRAPLRHISVAYLRGWRYISYTCKASKRLRLRSKGRAVAETVPMDADRQRSCLSSSVPGRLPGPPTWCAMSHESPRGQAKAPWAVAKGSEGPGNTGRRRACWCWAQLHAAVGQITRTGHAAGVPQKHAARRNSTDRFGVGAHDGVVVETPGVTPTCLLLGVLGGGGGRAGLVWLWDRSMEACMVHGTMLHWVDAYADFPNP
jgi:hypothetical protein